MLENSSVFSIASNVSSSTKSPAFGIDLGTTNSCISILREGKLPEVIPMRDGSRTLPSCVMYKGKESKAIVGKQAYLNRYKPNVAYSVKRLMGTGEKVKFSYRGETWFKEPYEVSAEILKELVYQISDRYKDVKDVVITVPADFDVKQIEDTLKAGELAGLNVLSIMREPTAASLVFGLEEKVDGNVLVYDLGGGTFDVSLLSIKKKDNDVDDLDALYKFEDEDEDESTLEDETTYVVKATRGDTRLGGDDFDLAMRDIIFKKIKSQGIDINYMPESYKESLLLRLENLKKQGVYNDYIMPISYEVTSKSRGKRVELEVKVSVNDFFEATRIIFEKTKALMDDLLKNYPGRLEGIVTVGGSTKNPIIQELLKNCYNVPVFNDLNPDESVSMGAAVLARNLKFKDTGVSVLDVISNGIGVYSDSKVVNVIPRDQMVPCSVTRLFSTAMDNQKEINVMVYSGNSSIPEECTELGLLKLENTEMGPAGTVGVLVKLSIDSNGLLSCETRVGDTFKKVTLQNVLGRQSKELNIRDKKILKWTTYANRLQDENSQSTLLQMIEDYKLNSIDEEQIISFIRSCRKRSLESYESSDSSMADSVSYENIE